MIDQKMPAIRHTVAIFLPCFLSLIFQVFFTPIMMLLIVIGHIKIITAICMILCDSTRENRAKAKIGDIFDLDGPIKDGTHYPRYLQGLIGLGL